jgi:hypothetical protein
MFLQLRTIQVGELRKRVSIGHVMPKIGTAGLLRYHSAGINNNAVDLLGGKEMMGTTERTPG